MLLQIMDEGRLTDSFGRHIDFRNTILIMTSNIGASIIKNQTQFGFAPERSADQDRARMKDMLKGEVERHFRPEFLNRVDDLIYFVPLTREDLQHIVTVQLSDLLQRLKSKNIELVMPDAARDFILERGYSPEFGARPLRRAIERYIEDPLSEEILRGRVKNGMLVEAEVHPDGLAFRASEKPEVVPQPK